MGRSRHARDHAPRRGRGRSLRVALGAREKRRRNRRVGSLGGDAARGNDGGGTLGGCVLRDDEAFDAASGGCIWTRGRRWSEDLGDSADDRRSHRRRALDTRPRVDLIARHRSGRETATPPAAPPPPRKIFPTSHPPSSTAPPACPQPLPRTFNCQLQADDERELAGIRRRETRWRPRMTIVRGHSEAAAHVWNAAPGIYRGRAGVERHGEQLAMSHRAWAVRSLRDA